MKLGTQLGLASERRNVLAGWTILLIGFLATGLVTYYVAKKNNAEDQLRFKYEVNTIIRRIQNRMSQYEGALIQTRAFLMNAENVNRKQLQSYIIDTQIFKRYPGLQGIGYSILVSPEMLDQHIREMRKDTPNYLLWPEGQRDIYSSIIVIEPRDWRNIRAIGFDMLHEPTRRKAMFSARDSNSATMTEKVVLVQETENEKSPGFNLYLPVFKKGHDSSTIESRRQNLVGFIYSPFRSQELFKAIFADLRMMVDVEIFDDVEPKKEKLLYNYDGLFEEKTKSGLWSERKIELAGRNILLRFHSLDNFNPASSVMKTVGVMMTGFLATYILYVIYLLTRRQMRIARIIASEKERLLKIEKEHVIARDDFLSIASHELKTPLTSLKLQAQVMKRAIDKKDPNVFSPEKVTNLISQIDNQTTRLTRLVDDMLDISRIRTGRLKMVKEELELSEVVIEVVERLAPQFLTSLGEVPSVECGQDIIGYWDRFRIEQVLMNLFTNAIRYGNNRPIKVKVEQDKSFAKIYVIDQGIGIAKENITKIFDRFERAGMNASEVSGMGLGLFITSQIVKAHGGAIDVLSEPDKGSTFIVSLPLKDAV